MNGLDTELSRALAAASTTRDVTIAAGSLGLLPAVLRRTARAARYVVVADDNTWEAAGRQASRTIDSAGLALADPVVLSEKPRVKPRLTSASARSASPAESGHSYCLGGRGRACGAATTAATGTRTSHPIASRRAQPRSTSVIIRIAITAASPTSMSMLGIK